MPAGNHRSKIRALQYHGLLHCLRRVLLRVLDGFTEYLSLLDDAADGDHRGRFLLGRHRFAKQGAMHIQLESQPDPEPDLPDGNDENWSVEAASQRRFVAMGVRGMSVPVDARLSHVPSWPGRFDALAF